MNRRVLAPFDWEENVSESKEVKEQIDESLIGVCHLANHKTMMSIKQQKVVKENLK